MGNGKFQLGGCKILGFRRSQWRAQLSSSVSSSSWSSEAFRRRWRGAIGMPRIAARSGGPSLRKERDVTHEKN
jgi:hypothetical protein